MDLEATTRPGFSQRIYSVHPLPLGHLGKGARLRGIEGSMERLAEDTELRRQLEAPHG